TTPRCTHTAESVDQERTPRAIRDAPLGCDTFRLRTGRRRSTRSAGMTNSTQRRSVVITGVSAISPVGLDAETTWRHLLAGVSGVGPITRFDTAGFETTIAAEVKGFMPDEILGKKDYRRMD